MGNAPLTALKAPYPPPPHPLLKSNGEEEGVGGVVVIAGGGAEEEKKDEYGDAANHVVEIHHDKQGGGGGDMAVLKREKNSCEQRNDVSHHPHHHHHRLKLNAPLSPKSGAAAARRISKCSTTSSNTEKSTGSSSGRPFFPSVFSRTKHHHTTTVETNGNDVKRDVGGRTKSHHRSLLGRFHPHHGHHGTHHHASSSSSSSSSCKVAPLTNVEKFGCRHKPGVLLYGCDSLEQHSVKVREVIHKSKMKLLHGEEGLREVGLEYRVVHRHCHQDGTSATSTADISCTCRFAQEERLRKQQQQQQAEEAFTVQSFDSECDGGWTVGTQEEEAHETKTASSCCPNSPRTIVSGTSSTSVVSEVSSSPDHGIATATSMAAAADSLCIRLSFDELEESKSTCSSTANCSKPLTVSSQRLAVTSEEGEHDDETDGGTAISLEESSVSLDLQSCRSSYTSSNSLGMLLGSVSECESEVTTFSATATTDRIGNTTTTTSTTITTTTKTTTLPRHSRRKKLHYHRQPQGEAWNHYHKNDCVRRLFHIDSGTMITEENRRQFVADGDMYEIVTDLCQEYAQECMLKEGHLKWVVICNDATLGEPVRAMVDQMDLPLMTPKHASSDDDNDDDDNHQQQPRKKTLLIVTGKGKVRAGIFSRKHLLVTGLEPSTAIPLIHEARQRGMHVAVLDPNARGDRNGMDTFEVSMERIFVEQATHSKTTEEEADKDNVDVLTEGTTDTCCSSDGAASITDSTTTSESAAAAAASMVKEENGLYVLAHSASGAQLVRYLLDKQLEHKQQQQQHEAGGETYNQLASSMVVSNPPPPCNNTTTTATHPTAVTPAAAFRIEAIAFTDSTHNIQWTKKNPKLRHLLENSNSLYVRSAHAHDSQAEEWHESKTGLQVDTDERWRHRFGAVKTLWAGTKMHELINWTAREHIWDHFDAQSNGN